LCLRHACEMFALLLTVICWSAAQAVATCPRHLLPVSKWRKNSKNKLGLGDGPCFRDAASSGDMDRILCEVGFEISTVIPKVVVRKEFFEAHSTARLIHKHFASGPWQVTELCAGCGLLAIFLVLLDHRRKVTCVDKVRQPVSYKLIEGLSRRWPELRECISYEVRDMRSSREPLDTGCLVVSCHACGLLSDDVIAMATAGDVCRPLVVLPCCHAKQTRLPSDQPWRPKQSWDTWPWLQEGHVNLRGAAAVDAARAGYLRDLGYNVCFDSIDSQITKYCVALVGS